MNMHLFAMRDVLARFGYACVLLALFLAGCATARPESAPGVEVSPISVSEVQQATENDTGIVEAVVRWGGTIARIDNMADGKTQLEIVSRPLQSGGRPMHNDQSDGRFLAEIGTFLDPEIVKTGRDITVLGGLKGIKEGKVGEATYRFPVVSVSDYRYWKPALPVRHFPHWTDYPPGYYDPFWYPWPYYYPYPRKSGISGSVLFMQPGNTNP